MNIDDPDESKNVVINSDDEAERNEAEKNHKKERKKKKSDKDVVDSDHNEDINWDEDELGDVPKSIDKEANFSDPRNKVSEDPDDGEFEWEPAPLTSEDLNLDDNIFEGRLNGDENLTNQKKGREKKTQKRKRKGKAQAGQSAQEQNLQENIAEDLDEDYPLKKKLTPAKNKIVLEELDEDDWAPDPSSPPSTQKIHRRRIILFSDEEEA